MATACVCEYGKCIKRRLLDLEKDHTWLVEEVKNLTRMYFDSPYLSKIISGERNPPKIIAAINEILEIPSNQDSA